MTYALVLFFTISYLYLCYRRLDWGLMLLLFLLPVYQIRFNLVGLPMTILEVMILSSFAVWFLTRTKFVSFVKRKYRVKDFLKARKERRTYPFRHELALVLIISYLAVGISLFSNASLGIWKAYFFEPILLYILVLNVFRQKDTFGNSYLDFEKIILPLSASALAVSLFAVLQKATGVMTVTHFLPRVTGVFPYPNALGLFLAPIILLSTGLIVNYKLEIKNYKFWLYLLSIIFSVIAIVLAGSEGALVGVFAAWFVVGILFLGKLKKIKAFQCTAKFLVLACIVFTLFSPLFFLKAVPEYKYYNFSSKTLNYVSDKLMLKDFSGEVRKQQWRETWEMMTASPQTFIFGTGLSAYQEAVRPYHQEGIFFNKDRDTDFRRKIVWFDEEYKAKHWRPVEIYMYPHNIFLNFWTELGLLGVLAFAWLFVKYFYLGFRLLEADCKNKGLIIGLIGTMIVIIIHGLVDVPYFKNDLSVMFWVLIAVMGAFSLNLESRKNKC